MPRMPIKLRAVHKPDGGTIIDIKTDDGVGVFSPGEETYVCPGCGRTLVKGNAVRMTDIFLRCGKCGTYCEAPA